MSETLFNVVVCCALTNSDGKFLLARRSPHKKLGGQWEFPGGKLELGEELFQALQREFREELSLEIHSADILHIKPFEYPHGRVLIVFYASKDFSGEPKPVDHDALEWCDFESVKSLPLLPANAEAFIKLKSWIQNHVG